MPEKQNHCRLYLDEFEQKLTCIAYGREPNDHEICVDIMHQQYEAVEENIEKIIEENGIEFNDLDEDIRKAIKDQKAFIENNPLHKTAHVYHNRTHQLLEETYYGKKLSNPQVASCFEIIAWYYTLLPAKLYRALCGFHEKMAEGDISLNDVVAQLDICKKAITESARALRTIRTCLNSNQKQIVELLALLNNIYSRIELLEQTI